MTRKIFNRYLTAPEEKKLFAHLRQFRAEPLARRDYLWMKLLRQTGLRVGNLARLTVADAFDVLTDPAHRLRLRDGDSKKSHGYEVKFSTAACSSLQGLLKLHGRRPDHAAPLVRSRNGGGAQALSVRSYESRMRQWVLSAGLGIEASPHWFRHTLAKHLLEETTAANPLQVVQHVLGHVSINSTAVYTYPDREEIERALEAASR